MGRKVFVIDDEPWSVIDLIKSIRWPDFDFETPQYFSCSTEALDSIIQVGPDLVFTDIRMPSLDGLELIKQAQSKGCLSKFIILSSFSEFDYAKEAIRSGVFDYCLKPIDPQIMTDVLRRVCASFSPKSDNDKDTKNESIIKRDPVLNVNLNKILKYLEAHLQDKIQLNDIAEEFFLSKNYICYLFQRYLNTTFGQYLTGLRVEKSKDLLSDPDLSLEHIAKKTGFSDEFYFNKVFKKYMNMTPGAYRKSLFS